MDKVARAQEILASIPTIVIATASGAGVPWNTPVHAVYDEEHHFYWISGNMTQHSQNIHENPNVYIVVYNSSDGSADCVYIQAKAYELIDRDAIERAIPQIYSKKDKPPRSVDEFIGETERRVYTAIPERFWINVKEDTDTDPFNHRKEIQL